MNQKSCGRQPTKAKSQICKDRGKAHPKPHAGTEIQLLKVLRGIQFPGWEQNYQAREGISAET